MAKLGDDIADKLDTLVEYESENGYNFRSDAATTIDLARWITIACGGAVIALGIVLAVALGSRLSRVIRGTTDAMTKLAAGDESAVVPGIGRRDELGRMAAALQVFKENARDKARLEEEKRAEQSRQEEIRSAHAAREAAFQGEIDAVVKAAVNGDFSPAHRVEGSGWVVPRHCRAHKRADRSRRNAPPPSWISCWRAWRAVISPARSTPSMRGDLAN